MIRKMLYGMLAGGMIFAAASMTVSAMPDLQTMYGPHFVTDDNFSMIMTYENSPIISGWDTDVSGGTITSSGDEEWFKISDTSTAAPVEMSKKLRKTENSVVIVETSIKMGNSCESSCFGLSGDSGENDFLRLYLSNGAICLDTGNKLKTVKQFALNSFYGIKFKINLVQKKYEFWLDGQYMGMFDFCNAVSSIDFVHISTGVKQRAELYLNGLKIYTGFELNEQFFAHTDGRIPEEWIVHTGNGAKTETMRAGGENWPDYYSAHLLDDSSVEYAAMEHKFSPIKSRGGLETKFCVENENQEFSLKWKNGKESVFDISSKNNALYLNDTKIYDYVKDVWYILSVDANFQTNTADVYINNRILLNSVKFNGKCVDSFEAATSITKHSELWLDDILAYEVNEPDSYVPEPKINKSDDFTVGMQTCDMWRDGQHLGWDFALPQPERIPVLGLYDDGSREAADWDIKWMLENGIDYRMTCWFTPRAYEGGPIKKGSNGYGLLDGAMRAKYSDKMKYAIIWENASNKKTDYHAFMNYIVPYWVEYFLKDPRYLVVDNKPIIYLYLADYFCKNQCGGDYDKAKEMLEYLRNECKKLGFDGCTVIASRSGYSEEYAADIGCDGIYNYIYGISEAQRGAKETNLENAKQKNEKIFVQPSISMGREESAWLRSGGMYSTVDDFKTALEYVRDDFYIDYSNYNLSEKLITLATWNEFCEGHYIAPAGLAGFGYLNAVREVFTDAKEYSPQVPYDNEKQNFSILFPQNREPGMRGTSISVPISDNVIKEWSGDALKSWTVGKQIEGFAVENSEISGTSVGLDPSIMSEDNLGINVEGVTYVRVRIKQESTKKELSLFFIRDDDTKWNEAKGITLTSENAQDGYYDVLFPVWMRETWKGTLRQLRIDPLNATGGFKVQKIELLKGNSGDLPRIKLDSVLCPIVSSVSTSSARAQAIPVLIDGKTYLPLDCFMRYFNVKMIYIPGTHKIKASTQNTLLEIDTITGKSTVNSVPTENISIKIYSGQYVVALRDCMEALGYKVEWNDKESIAELTSPVITEEKINKDPAGTWNFNGEDDLQGWTATKTISNISVMGGICTITSNSTDPQLLCSKLSLDAAKYKTLKLRLKNSTKSTLAELFFATDKDATLNAEKSIKITIEPQTEEFVEYEIDIKNETWKDTITLLRFDPMTAVGDIQIDYIILSEE